MKRFALALLFAFGACADPAVTPPPADAGTDRPVAPADRGNTADAAVDAPACMPSSTQPAPRGDSVGVVDPATGFFYLFGGDTGRVVSCMAMPAFSDETWRYDPRCDRWDRLQVDAHPSARSRMAWALDTRRRRMIVFGGRYRAGATGAYTNYRDVWSFDLATERWQELMPTGEAPLARANAAATYDPEGDAVILFGGNTSTNGAAFAPRNDTWALDLAEPAWRRITTTGTAPSARLFHAVTVSGRSLVLYGGGGSNAFTGPFLSDMWRLDLGSNAWATTRLTGSSTALGGRIGAALVPMPNGDITVVAGHDDGALGNRNDLLSVTAAGAVRVMRRGDELQTPGAGFCDFPADFTSTDEASPERRSAFVIAHDPMRNRAIVYGGKTDCGLAGDVWSLNLMDGSWRPLRGSTDGLSCQRSGRENCRTLCN